MVKMSLCQRCQKVEGKPYPIYYGKFLERKLAKNSIGKEYAHDLIEPVGWEGVVLCAQCVRRNNISSKIKWSLLFSFMLVLGFVFGSMFFSSGDLAWGVLGGASGGIGIIGLFYALKSKVDDHDAGSKTAVDLRKAALKKMGYDRVWPPDQNQNLNFSKPLPLAIPTGLLEDGRVTRFYQTSLDAWSQGELAELSSGFEKEGTSSLDEVIKRYPPVLGSAYYASLENYPPREGEYLIGGDPEWFVLTNYRIIIKDGKEECFKEIDLAEVNSYEVEKEFIKFILVSGAVLTVHKVKMVPSRKYLLFAMEKAKSGLQKPALKGSMSKQQFQDILQQMVNADVDRKEVWNQAPDLAQANNHAFDPETRTQGIQELKAIAERFPASQNVCALVAQALDWDGRQREALEYIEQRFPEYLN